MAHRNRWFTVLKNWWFSVVICGYVSHNQMVYLDVFQALLSSCEINPVPSDQRSVCQDYLKGGLSQNWVMQSQDKIQHHPMLPISGPKSTHHFTCKLAILWGIPILINCQRQPVPFYKPRHFSLVPEPLDKTAVMSVSASGG